MSRTQTVLQYEAYEVDNDGRGTNRRVHQKYRARKSSEMGRDKEDIAATQGGDVKTIHRHECVRSRRTANN